MNRRPIQVDRGTRGIFRCRFNNTVGLGHNKHSIDISFGSPQYGQIYQTETTQKVLCEGRHT